MSELPQNKGFQIRPRFMVESPLSVIELDAAFNSKLKGDKGLFDSQITEGYVSIYPNASEHHYWSPHLSVAIESSDEGSLLRGHFGPSPAVWTMFVFLYSVIGLSIVIFTIIGFAYRSIGHSSLILWAVPFLIIVFLSLYYVSFIGQKKGHDQIEELHRYFEKCIGQEIS